MCSPKSLAWSAGEFDQIYLVPMPEETHLQPQKLLIEGLVPALLGLKGSVEGGMRPLFNPDTATAFARGLVAALGTASPAQDALFLITTSAGFLGLFGNPLGNSGRAFIDRNGLNLIFGEIGVDFVGPYHIAGKVRKFEFGSRSEASHSQVTSSVGKQARSDWVVISIKPADGTKTPAVTGMDQNELEAQEQRLKRLKQLREKNLITAQEYEAKKAEILKKF